MDESWGSPFWYMYRGGLHFDDFDDFDDFVSCDKSSDNSLLRMFSPSLGNVPAFAPVELSLTFPRLLVLRLGLNSLSHNLGGLPSSAQFAFHQFSVIRSTRRFLRLQLSVVVACLLYLGARHFRLVLRWVGGRHFFLFSAAVSILR